MKNQAKGEIPVEIEVCLRRIGLSDKEAAVYLTLVELGPSSVRSIAVKSKINRGTTYEVLKALIERGLVSYFQKVRHQYFAAEDPKKLAAILEAKTQELVAAGQQLNELLPILSARQGAAAGRPRIRFFEGTRGVRVILEDVLETMARQEKKEYRVYSFADVREHIYIDFRDYNKRRIKLGIKVRAIALGGGGKLSGLDERRWIEAATEPLTYQILYADKFAMISLDDNRQPVGSLVEDARIAATQALIFDRLWVALGPAPA